MTLEEKMKKIAEKLGSCYLIDSLIESCTNLALTANKAKKEITPETPMKLLSCMLSTKMNIELIIHNSVGEADFKKFQEDGLERLYKAVVEEGKK